MITSTTDDTARHREWLDRQTAEYRQARADIIDNLAGIWGHDTARRYVNDKLGTRHDQCAPSVCKDPADYSQEAIK